MRWEQWRRTIFGDPYLVWHDGADYTALLAAAARDLPAVTTALRAGLAEQDPLAASSYAALTAAGHAPPGARADLVAALPSASGTFAVNLGRALYVLTGNGSWAAPVAKVLATGGSWSERLDAAMALADFPPTATLVDALALAVCDPEYLVRYHAANTLRRYAGIQADISANAKLFALITSDASPDSWKKAATLLAGAVR